MISDAWLRARTAACPEASQDPQVLERLTPNLACPACLTFRMHSPNERNEHHPDSGKGHSRSHGAPPPITALET